MSSSRLLDSASGLRPASAFVVIASVLALVGGRAALLAHQDEPEADLEAWRESSLKSEDEPLPAYSIVDRDGRPLAVSEVRFDLKLSPRAMWQAHTPVTMAHEISRALGGTVEPGELLLRMLPDADEGGLIRVRNPDTGQPLVLDEARLARVEQWIHAATLDEAGRPQALLGFSVEPARNGWRLCWQPAVVLSPEMRALHRPGSPNSPMVFGRFLADGLAPFLFESGALRPGPQTDDEELQDQRDEVWEALMPSQYVVALEGFDARYAKDLATCLEEQKVAQHQMSIERERKRSYPAGRSPLLGYWGRVDDPTTRIETLKRLGYSKESLKGEGVAEGVVAGLDESLEELYDTQFHERRTNDHPRAGLELACAELLDDPRWDFLRREPATFSYRLHRPVALRGTAARLRSYFESATEPVEPPRVVTTLDSLLQGTLDTCLEQLVETYRPAVAQAIVLEVDSGAVLAVGARSPYRISGWAPVMHQFMPGSTFKVPIMAIALDTGAVEPWTEFDVGDGNGYRLPGRTIREVLQSPKTGIQTATECLAHSINAGMVQIGLGVAPETLCERLLELRYAAKPGTGLGSERAGKLPDWPWKTSWGHASVCYGYETQVTLWQHAAALSAIVGGGAWKPLRLLAAVEQDGRRWDLPAAEPDPVFSARTCAEVREMMHQGALIGTGRAVFDKPPYEEGFVERYGVGTKTGTAERVHTEPCVHVELAHHERHAQDKTKCYEACRVSMLAQERPHGRACKTLSMVAFARRPSDGRDVMVLVVVDEPLQGSRYGSDTAGPAAGKLLREALGLTVFGAERGVERVAGFRRGARASEPTSEQPWAEVGR